MLSYLTHIRSYCETICSQYSSFQALENDLMSEGNHANHPKRADFENHLFVNVAVHVKQLKPIVNLVFTLTKLSATNPDEIISFQSLG